MRFGQRHGETLRDQLAVESVRLPRWMLSEVRQHALQSGVSVSECYRRVIAAGLATAAPPQVDGEQAA